MGLVVLAALIAAGAALTVARTLAAGPKPVSFTFPPTSLPGGLVATRTWSSSGSGYRQFRGELVVGNATSAPVTATVTEVIPESIAASVGVIRFDPAPDRVLRPDPVVAYRVTALPPGATRRLSYGVTVAASGRPASRLRAWATDQEAAAAVAYPEVSPPARLAGLAFSTGPGPVQLVPGATLVTTVTATLSDGSPAPESVVAGVAWSSSNPAVVTVTAGRLLGVGPGSATVTAQAGAVHSGLSVVVLAPMSSPIAPAPPVPARAPARPAPAPPVPARAPARPAPAPPASGPPPPNVVLPEMPDVGPPALLPSPSPPPLPNPAAPAYHAVYRLVLAGKDVFYSSDLSQVNGAQQLGYAFFPTPAPAFYGCDPTSAVAVAVYRLLGVGIHFYTASATARDALVAIGFRVEPEDFWGCAQGSAGAVPVYLVQETAAPHLAYYTTDLSSANLLASGGRFTAPAVAFFARSGP